MATGPMSRSTSRCPEGSASGGGSARRRQAVGLSLKIWRADAPISTARSATRTRPRPIGRWRPPVALRAAGRAGSIAGRHRRLRCFARSMSSGYQPSGGVGGGSRQPGGRFDAACTRRRSPARSTRSRRCGACTGRILLRFGVHEDEEVVPQLLHPLQGVLLEHGLDRETLRLDDARATRVPRPRPPARGAPRGEPAGRPRLALAPAEPCRVASRALDGLALDPVDDDVQAGLVGGPEAWLRKT